MVAGIKRVAGCLVLSAGLGVNTGWAEGTFAHQYTTLTETVGGHTTTNGYFHGPAGGFTTLGAVPDPTLLPYRTPASYPGVLGDLVGTYGMLLDGITTVPGNDSRPFGEASVSVASVVGPEGEYIVAATAQTLAESVMVFNPGDGTTAAADVGAENLVAYQSLLTFDSPYRFAATGVLDVAGSSGGSPSANTTISSAVATGSASLLIQITDGEANYDFGYTSLNDPTFSIAPMWLGAGATVRVTITASSESGLTLSAFRDPEAVGDEVVAVSRSVLTQAYVIITPEPGTALLLGVGALGLLARRRR